jgi:MFS family permease
MTEHSSPVAANKAEPGKTRYRPASALVAGVLGGICGLLAFLIIHALWITPIWFILPLGLLVAGSGGLAVGWAYMEIFPRLPERVWSRLLVFLTLIWLILLPSLALAELRRPVFTLVEADPVLNMSVSEAALRFIFELLVSAAVLGGLIGWWLGRTRRAAFATALAGFIFALGPGHNIPFIGGTSGVGKELAIMLVIISVSSLVLVLGHARFPS